MFDGRGKFRFDFDFELWLEILDSLSSSSCSLPSSAKVFPNFGASRGSFFANTDDIEFGSLSVKNDDNISCESICEGSGNFFRLFPDFIEPDFADLRSS